MHIVRRVLRQQLHQSGRARIGGMVEVIEYQVDLACGPGQCIDQQSRDCLQACVSASGHQQQVLVHRQPGVAQGSQQTGAERLQRGVVRGHGQPGDLRTFPHQRLPPLGDQRGLAEPGTARHQQQTTVAPVLQLRQQLFTRHGMGANARRRELGCDQLG
ncbi:hypothetical protein FQZ97_786530 [compost metagenome]